MKRLRSARKRRTVDSESENEAADSVMEEEAIVLVAETPTPPKRKKQTPRVVLSARGSLQLCKRPREWNVPEEGSDPFRLRETEIAKANALDRPTGETQLWIDKYAPATDAETAVHKRKVQDVRDWLQTALVPTLTDASSRCFQPKQRMLVLHGPSGSGKSAVVRMLSMELNFDIVEWINGVNENALELGGNENAWRDTYVPVLQRFAEFLKQADRYPALEFGGCNSTPKHDPHDHRKVILVEDLPPLSTPTLRRDLQQLIHGFLESRRTAFPLVFIVSDFNDDHQQLSTLSSFEDLRRRRNQSGGSGEALHLHNLLPPNLLHHPLCRKITFNPVAKTILKKLLSDIVAKEYRQFALRPSAATVQCIAESSDGDLRTAINTLQFVSLYTGNAAGEIWEPNTGSAGKSNSKQKKATELEHSHPFCIPYISCKDSKLDLFHALGKILYAKHDTSIREFPDVKKEQFAARFQPFLQQPPFLTPINEVLSSLPVDDSLFLVYLNNNYLALRKDVDEELLLAADYFSLADTLPPLYAGMIAATSVALTSHPLGQIASSYSSSSSSLHSLTKPALFQCMKQRKDLCTLGMEHVSRLEETTVGSASVVASGNPFLEHLPFRAMIAECRASKTLTRSIAPTDQSLYRCIRTFSDKKSPSQWSLHKEAIRERQPMLSTEQEAEDAIVDVQKSRVTTAALVQPVQLLYLPHDDIEVEEED